MLLDQIYQMILILYEFLHQPNIIYIITSFSSINKPDSSVGNGNGLALVFTEFMDVLSNLLDESYVSKLFK